MCTSQAVHPNLLGLEMPTFFGRLIYRLTSYSRRSLSRQDSANVLSVWIEATFRTPGVGEGWVPTRRPKEAAEQELQGGWLANLLLVPHRPSRRVRIWPLLLQLCGSRGFGCGPGHQPEKLPWGVRPTRFRGHYRSIFQICQLSTIPAARLVQNRDADGPGQGGRSADQYDSPAGDGCQRPTGQRFGGRGGAPCLLAAGHKEPLVSRRPGPDGWGCFTAEPDGGNACPAADCHEQGAALEVKAWDDQGAFWRASPLRR